MSLSISSLTPITQAAGAAATRPVSPTPSAGGLGFSSVLDSAIQAVEEPGNKASQAIQNLLKGDGEELHTVALAVQRAELAFDLGLQVRNKVVSAYQEIMRMQL